MWIVELALRRPFTIAVFSVLIFLMGFLCLRGMPVDIFPVIDIPVVGVVWTYPGLSAEDMERRVVLLSERSLSTTVNGIARIESQSIPGIGFLRIYFQEGATIGGSIAQISAVCETSMRAMPPGIQPPVIVQFNASNVPVVQMTMSSDTMPEERIFDYALNFIRIKLFTLPGLSVPAPYGGKIRQVNVDVDPSKTTAHGLSPDDVVSALLSSNLIVPAGTVRIGSVEYNVQLNSSPPTVKQFNEIPIKVVNGIPINLANVARIDDSFADQTNIVRVNGKRAAYLNILKKSDASTLAVVDSARRILPEIKATAPKDLDVRLDFDQSTFVRAAISSVLREALISSLLVSAMILFFLGSWRSVIVVCTSIPLAIFTAIIGLKFTGNTINIMTLGGLSLAIGMLVDDATVEVENIHRNRGLGHPLTVAILTGAREIALPAIMATLAICIVFFPVALLTGPARFLFIPMALSVVFSMLASYVLSRSLVPLLSRILLEGEHHESHGAQVESHPVAPPSTQPAPPRRQLPGHRIRAVIHQRVECFFHGLSRISVFAWLFGLPIFKLIISDFGHCARRFTQINWADAWVGFNAFREKAFDGLQSRYDGLLRTCMENRSFCLKLFFGVLGLTLFVPFLLGHDFFPTTDMGLMKLHFRATSGKRIEETEVDVAEVERTIRRIIPKDELESINSMIGVPNSSYNLAFVPTDNVAGMDAEIMVHLKEDHRPTAGYMKKIRQALTQEFPGATMYFQPADIVSQVLNFGLSSPIDVQVENTDVDESYRYAKILRDKIRGVPGAADVSIKQVFDYPTLKLNANRDRAAEVGLTQSDISNSLLISLSSSSLVAPSYFLNPKNSVNYGVVVKVPLRNLMSVDDVLATPLTAPLSRKGPSGGQLDAEPQGVKQFQDIKPYSAPAVTLGNVAVLDTIGTMDEVNHYNVQRIVDVTANVEGRDLGGVVGEIRQKVKELGNLPVGMKIRVRGQGEVMDEAFTNLGLGLILAIILVFLLMVILFQSWLDPFIVLVAIPGALTGILWMLLLTGTTINVESFMGSIMAVGIAASNSILMVSFANEVRIEKGLSAVEAALAAGRTRLRPVIMTAFAMIIGMLPAALGLGEGGEQNAPLGRAVIGGLLVATVVTLFIVPLVYSALRTALPMLHLLDAKFQKEKLGGIFDPAAAAHQGAT